MRPRLIAAAAVLAGLVCDGSALAAAPSASPEPVEVSLHFRGEGWHEDFGAEVEADLAAELARDHIRLVHADAADAADAARAPIASIQLEITEAPVVRIEIRICDAVTDKTVLRDIDLSETPAEARSLELAIATQELLQASWAELALTPSEATPPRASTPPAVEALLERRLEAGPSPQPLDSELTHWISAKVLTLASFGGLVWLGAGANYELWPIDRLGVGLGVGALGLIPARYPSGRLTGVAGFGEFSLVAGAVRSPRAAFDLLAGTRGFVLRVRGRSAEGGDRSSAHVLGELRFGLRPALRVGPVWLFTGVELTYAPGELAVRDATQIVARYGEVSLGGAIGVRGAL